MEQENTGKTFLKKSIRIGSCKLPSSYQLNEATIIPSDIPDYVKSRRENVLEWKKYVTLIDEDKQPIKDKYDHLNWNKSNKVDKPIVESRKMENFVHDRSNNYQYNFRAETIECLKNLPPIEKTTKFHISTQTKKEMNALQTLKNNSNFFIKTGIQHRTQEIPVNPKLEDATSWNNSTSITPKEFEQLRKEKLVKAIQWTKNKNKLLGTTIPYTTQPIKTQVEFQNTIRKQKEDGTFNIEKPVYRPKSAEQPAQQTHNRNAIEPSRAYKTYQHSGVWEYNPIEKRHMWSDTGSFEYESKGDLVKKHNPDGYNYIGPTTCLSFSERTMHLKKSESSSKVFKA